MDRVLRRIPEASAYIDDILVTSDTWEEHLVHLKKTLTALRDAGLTSKLKKCVFVRPNIEFLGHCVGRGHLKPQAAKTKAIADFRVPKKKKHLRAFLGLSGYYRKFIPWYAHTTAVLTEKKSPDVLPWEPKHQGAFEKIKTQLSSDPLLVAPNHDKTFSLHTDASYVGLGAVLTQKDDNNLDKPVAYYSRKLIEREQNYTATEIELLGVVEAVKHFSVYLLGKAFRLVTDHRALVHLTKMKNTNPRLMRWSLALQQFDVEVVYKKGAANTDADGLSRQAWPSVDVTSGSSLRGGL